MMQDSVSLTGRCLCGAVSFTAEVSGDEVGACHCSICRRQASGPMFAALGVRAVTFDDEANLVRYRSSEWVERGFCGICGSKLFSRVIEGDHYHVCPTAFDDQERWRFTEEIFIDSKPDYYDFANETRRLTGAEFVAAYMGDDGAGEAQP